MSKQAVFDYIGQDMESLERGMMAAVASPLDLLTDIGRHLIAAGGKRLRPALFFLAARGGAASPERYRPMAVAIELIHMATLVHDDVVDRSDMRRGQITANAKWDNKVAVLSGDYLFAQAFRIVAEQDYGAAVISVMSQTISDLSEGEIVQNRQAFGAVLTEAEYTERIAKKTANFIAASCRLGAMIAGRSQQAVDGLASYGRAVGMAFQITDDIMDITSTQQQTGKPVGNDLLQGIITLPVMRALQVSPAAAELRRLVADKNIGRDGVERALQLVRETAGIDYSYCKVKEYLDFARTSIPAELNDKTQVILREIADFIENRDF